MFTESLLGNDSRSHVEGRWPANVVHDGSDEVVGMFPQSGGGNILTIWQTRNT